MGMGSILRTSAAWLVAVGLIAFCALFVAGFGGWGLVVLIVLAAGYHLWGWYKTQRGLLFRRRGP